jgi:hypothetical protein
MGTNELAVDEWLFTPFHALFGGFFFSSFFLSGARRVWDGIALRPILSPV